MPLLHQSVTMKTVVPDLPLISFSQPHNLCRSLCRATLRQTASVNDEPPRPSQSCGKSRCKLCLSLICSNYISSTATIKTFKCYNDNTSCDSKWIIYVISCPICNLQYVGQSNKFRARMNGHKRDFRLYVAGKINKMNNKLLYDHFICHYIDCFHVSIVDMIQVGNNTESQLDELHSRKERKWIWDLCSITPNGLSQDDGYYCQNKRCRKKLSPLSDITSIYSHIFSYILTAFIISQYSVQCVRLHFATFMCNINYKFIYYSNLPFSYNSQFIVIIFFDNSVTGYITLLCITIT